MGRGDKRTFRGKIFAGSYGNTRLQKVKKKAAAKTGAGGAKAQPGR
jgi:ribosomal small subunit protein bTHX